MSAAPTSLPIEAEVREAANCVRRLIDTYVDFGARFRHGEIHQWLYSEILEFVNFRMETARSVLLLADSDQIADALGLCRPLLENYLLLKLICRGQITFQLQDMTNLSEGAFKAKIRELQEENESRRDAGGDAWIDIRPYRRAKRHAMYVYKGLASRDEPDFLVPVHYFQFKDFKPATMRLDAERYFKYFETPPDLAQALKQHRAGETYRYKHYLSYDALIECLELNNLVSEEEQARIDAHYTFLGQFIHPTHEAARPLHASANIHDGKPGVGMPTPYERAAALLALVYVIHILADILDEVGGLFEDAPTRFIHQPGTEAIRSVAADARSTFDYFWLVYNDAPYYDRWLYAIHHLSDEDLASYGGIHGVPSHLVSFHQQIYSHFKATLGSYTNQRCGEYVSPLARRT